MPAQNKHLKPLLIGLAIALALVAAAAWSVTKFLSRLSDYGIWVEDLATRKAEKLTTEGVNVNPSLSPDGTRIVFDHSGSSFFKQGPRSIRLLNLTDRSTRTLINDGQLNVSPSWCGNDRIVYAAKKGESFDLWAYSLSNGELKRLTEDAQDESEPRCSPDGQILAFRQKDAKGNDQLFMMPAEGGEKRQMTDEKDFLHEIKSPFWAGPDELLFFSFMTLKGINREGHNTLRLDLTGLNNFSFPRAYPGEPGWIFFKGRPSDSTSFKLNFYLISRTSGEIKVLDRGRDLLEMGYNLSEDGKTLVYCRP